MINIVCRHPDSVFIGFKTIEMRVMDCRLLDVIMS